MAKLKYKDVVENSELFFKDIIKNADELLIKLTEVKKGFQDVAKNSATELKNNKGNSAEDLKKYTQATGNAKRSVKELGVVEVEIQKIYENKLKAYAQLQASSHKENLLLQETQYLLSKEKTLTKEKLQFQQAERGSIKQLEAANKILVRRRRELNLATEEGIKKYNNLSSAIKKNEDKLKSHDKAIGRHFKNVGNYKDGIGKVSSGLMNMVSVLGITGGALAAFHGVMSSNEAIADKFRNTTAGLGGAFSFLGNALATMDFSNLISGMQSAFNEASRYEKKVDELGDRERALQNQLAERERDQAEAYTKARQLKKTDPKEAERQLIEYERLEKEKLKLQLAYNKIVLDNEIKNVQKIVQNQSKGVKVSEQTIKDFINNYDTLVDNGVFEKGLNKYNELIRLSQDEVEKYDKATQTYYKDRVFSQEKFIKNYQKLTQEQKKSISLGLLEKNLVTKNDDDSRSSREKISKAINQSIKDEKESFESSGKIARTMQSVRAEIFGEQQANIKAVTKTKEDALKAEEQMDKEDIAFMENSLKIQEEALKSAQETNLELIYDSSKKEKQIIREKVKELLRIQDEALVAGVISQTEYDIRIREIAQKQADDLHKIELDKAKRQEAIFDRQEKKAEEKRIDDQAKKQKAREDMIDAEVQALNYIADLYQKNTDLKLKQLEKEKEASQNHENTLRALAETRSESVTDNLAFEQKRQAEIRKEEMKLEKRKQKTALITSSIDMFSARLKNNEKNALGNTIADVTTLISFISSLPAFKDGVIDFQGKGTGTSDSNLALLSKGETVMTAKETADYKPVFTAIRKGTYQESNAMTVNELQEIKKAILSKPEYHYDINSMADMITERIKKNNTIIVNHYKKGGLC